MDNFTLSVLVGGVAVIGFFVVLLVLDKKKAAPSGGTERPAGKPLARRL